MDDFPSSDDCTLCGHIHPVLRPMFREALVKLPLQKLDLICEACIVGWGRNAGFPVEPVEPTHRLH
jgi:hypothetical protein